MVTPQTLAPLNEQLPKAQTVFVLLGENPSYDAVAAALSLYLALKQSGKSVQIACPESMRVEFSYLVGVDEIKTEVGNQNLVASFPYDEKNVEKVSYTISDDGKRFNLMIAPKTGGAPLQSNDVKYSYAGAFADLVFMVGVFEFEELGGLYEAEPGLFNNAYTVSLTPYETTPFAKLTLDTQDQSSLSEGVTQILVQAGIEPKDDVATNLLSGIEQTTNRFQSLAVNPDTFEIVARLLRNGARRSSSNPVLPQQTPTIQPGMSQFPQHLFMKPSVPQASEVDTSSFAQVLKQQHMNAPVGDEQQIHQLQHSAMPTQPAEQTPQAFSPPKDWLQPKVFTGTSKV